MKASLVQRGQNVNQVYSFSAGEHTNLKLKLHFGTVLNRKTIQGEGGEQRLEFRVSAQVALKPKFQFGTLWNRKTLQGEGGEQSLEFRRERLRSQSCNLGPF